MTKTPRLGRALLRNTTKSIYGAALLLLVMALPFRAGAQSALSFSKSFSPSTIGPGSVSNLTFVISNNTGSPAMSVAFTDNLPAGVTVATPANASSDCLGARGGSLSAPDGGSAIELSGGAVGGNSSCVVSVDVTSSTLGTHTNISQALTSSLGTHGTATADLTVASDRPDFSKSFSPVSVALGGRSTLTFTIDNTASASAAFNLNFTDNLPANMAVASPANASTTCTGGVITAVAGAGVISYGPQFFGDASVAAGASCTVSVDVVGNATGDLTNVSGELTSTPPVGSPTRSSGVASATLNVTGAVINFSKSFTDDPVAPGGTVTLEFTITNTDRVFSATNISFTDDLDAALSGLAAGSLPSSPCGPGSALSGTSLLSLTGGNLAPGASCTFSAALDVPASAGTGAFTNTTSSVTADLGLGQVSGSAASDVLFVSPIPTLTKTFLDNPVGSGGTTTLEFTITNTSSTSTATDIAFTDIFAEVLPTASAVPANGFCGAGSTAVFQPLIIGSSGSSTIPSRLTVFGAELAAGASCTFSITLDIEVTAATGTYENTTSEITATIDGETLVGDPASDLLEVFGGPTLMKQFLMDPVAPGGTVMLSFELTSPVTEGQSIAYDGITFTDDLESALSGLVVATSLPISACGGTLSFRAGEVQTLEFAGGSVSAGQNCSFVVDLTVPGDATPGAHTNTTSNVMATSSGVAVEDLGAEADLLINGLELSKSFTPDSVLPGDQTTLSFTIDNITTSEDATNIFFTDDLDFALDGLVAASGELPQNDICGTGSSLALGPGQQNLIFQGGTLAAGTSCTFDVVLDVPATAVPEVYRNLTGNLVADIAGSQVAFDPASAFLTVSDALGISKEFTDDPAAPGGTVTLQFTISNLTAAGAVTDIAFTDDLDAVLAGLVAVGLPVSECGGTVSGTNLISFIGGSVAAASDCSFSVSLSIPAGAAEGVFLNTTSTITGMLGGNQVSGDPDSDELEIAAEPPPARLEFSKTFLDTAGGVDNTVVLQFNIDNTGPAVMDLSFTDDLDAVIPGLVATGLPQSDVCGVGSVFDGTSLLTLTDGSLFANGSCTFNVTLEVPTATDPGSFFNATSDLVQDDGVGAPVVLADPASDFLVVTAPLDADGDGVGDGEDACPGTVIPEGVPTQNFGVNRFALTENDTVFRTRLPGQGGIVPSEFTTEDTAGCSCEQIVAGLGVDDGHLKFGCSRSVMEMWINQLP